MNKHLEPVFNILLPGLESSGIDYWVYGGVSVAACAGKFIRRNDDVDIFVKNNDFEKAKLILDDVCNQKNFEHSICKGSNRPKLDIKIDNEKVLSMVPVYPKYNIIEFKYPKGNEEYSNHILKKEERRLSSYRFFTPQDRFIKEIFINHISARQDKKKRKKFQTDARAILNPEELVKLDWHID